jgi:hypothetical protein
MHVPKSAGNSVREMLEEALPSGSLAHRRIEPSNFCAFDDFDRLPPPARATIAATEDEFAELTEHRAICGHFSLQTLKELAPRENIATVLREPRSRLISSYLYMRFKTGLRTRWGAYGFHTAAEGTLAEFLDNPRVATATDNKTCRMLMHGDDRIRDGEFIAEDELDSIAEEAWERLDGLGFVGLLELPDEAWRGIGEHFGVELRPVFRNVSGREDGSGRDEIQEGMLPVPPFGGARTLELLERRSAADARLYHRAAARARGAEEAARTIADAAFAGQLVRYGAFTSDWRTELEGERRSHAQTRERLQSSSEDLARTNEALDSIMRSRSWRITAPLRRARRALGRLRGAAKLG